MCKKCISLTSFVLVLALAGSVSAGLLGHWAFDDGSGTAAQDSSANNNHGILMGDPQWVAGKLSMALQFDGVDDYVEVPHDARLIPTTGKATVSVWINAERHTGPGGSQWQGILAKGGGPRLYSLYTESSQVLHFSTGPSPHIGSLSTDTVPLNEWVHVAAVVDGRHIYYINGEPAGEGGQGATVPTGGTAPLTIGQTGESNFFLGMIDDVRLYDRALTAEQVQGLFNGIAPAWLKAENPSPPDGAEGVAVPLLTWTPGENAQWHDVYLSTTPDPGPEDLMTRNQKMVTMYYHVDGLTPGVTYYWRIDEVQLDDSIITGDVWSFTAATLTAWSPDPPDGAKYVGLDADLNWSSGTTGVWHEVYFGTDETAVATGAADTFKGRQNDPPYDPGPLAGNTTYYWRIDEIEGDGTKKHIGEVWSFTTQPDIPIADPNLVGWWEFDEGQGTIALDWSGYNNHGTLMEDAQWAAGYDGDAVRFDGIDDYVEVSHDETLTVDTEVTVMAWINTQRYGGPGADYQGIIAKSNNPRSYSLYTTVSGVLHFSTTSGGAYVGSVSSSQVPLNEWVHVCAMVVDGMHRYYINGAPAGQGGGGITLPGAADTDTVLIGVTHEGSNEFLGMIDDVRIYRKALTPEEIEQVMRGDPSLAWNPQPANRSTPDIEKAAVLTWSAGEKAAQHDVYFGTDRTAVENADASDTTGIYRDRRSTTSYMPPDALEWGQTYYWRIDEYNADTTISTGRVWSFTIAEYLIVDDFEDYNDYTPDRLWQTWLDGVGYNEPPPGYAGNGTGSQVGNDSTPFTEQNTVHGDLQAMTFRYTNDGSTGKALYSETERTWAVPQDWTRYAVKALSLWFYGDAANSAEPLYVGVQDSLGTRKDVPHENSNAVLLGGWQEWNVDLQGFANAGVNLTSVKKMYIGVGNRLAPQMGGTGRLYFDDIRLYKPRCIPSLAKPDVELSGDCVVDYADLQILTDQWLRTGYLVTPTDPGTNGLAGYWKFDGNTNDSSGNGLHGTAMGMPTYAAGKSGQAIRFDGIDDYVVVGAVGISGAAPRTISGWAKADALGLPAWIDIFGFTGPSGAGGHFDIEHVGDTATTTLGYYGLHVYGWEQDILPVDLEWHHLAASYDGTTAKWYGDGRFIGSSPVDVNTPDNAHMGKRQDNENYFPGSVDEVRIYNRVLSDGEVASLGGLAEPYSEPFDLNVDGTVDFADYALLMDAWLEELLWP